MSHRYRYRFQFGKQCADCCTQSMDLRRFVPTSVDSARLCVVGDKTRVGLWLCLDCYRKWFPQSPVFIPQDSYRGVVTKLYPDRRVISIVMVGDDLPPIKSQVRLSVLDTH